MTESRAAFLNELERQMRDDIRAAGLQDHRA